MMNLAQNSTTRSYAAQAASETSDHLDTAQAQLERLTGAFSNCAEDRQLSRTEATRFRKLAAELATTIASARAAADETRRQMAANDVIGAYSRSGQQSLRTAVDDAIDNIEGIVDECRHGIDQAVTMHVYMGGREYAEPGALWDAEEDMSARFNAGVAQAAGALKCLLSYLEPLRAPRRLRAVESIDVLDAAAEE